MADAGMRAGRAARMAAMEAGTVEATVARVTLAIVGTAGRKVVGPNSRLTDGERLTAAMFGRMCDAARAVVRARRVTHLVSGGAAWSDHVAAALVLDGTVPAANLTIHAPAALLADGYDESSRDGATCNRYHRAFSRRTGVDTLAQLREAVRLGARLIVNPLGFNARNSDVAGGSDLLLAFTFGTGEPWRARVHGPGVTAERAGLSPAGTGTVDTWGKSRARERIHVTLAELD